MTWVKAILARNASAVEQALAQGVDVNEIDPYGFTPLEEAAIVNDEHIGALLLSHGADPRQVDLVGGTALHWAVENSNEAFCRLLLERGADANAYNRVSEPVLVKPLLRGEQKIRDLLYEFGAKSRFAWDYVNLKLLGHRYDLRGEVDIVDTHGEFTELGLEGFFFEFSLNALAHSLISYRDNFAARRLGEAYAWYDRCIEAMSGAAELMRYQQYQIPRDRFQSHIDTLLNAEWLIIPVNFEGHAITFIRYRNMWVRLDRRKEADDLNGVVFFTIRNPKALTPVLLNFLIYEKKTGQFLETELVQQLDLQYRGRLLLPPQVAGNCSWANTVACLPVFLFLGQGGFSSDEEIIDWDHPSLALFRAWEAWDRNRALHYVMDEFTRETDPARRASLIAALGMVFFQRMDHRRTEDLEQAKRVHQLLKTPGYEYVLAHYLEAYSRRKLTPAGAHLKALIAACESFY